MGNGVNTPDLFSGLPGDDNEHITTSLDGSAKVRARNKREYVNTTPEQFHALIDKAIAEGRHSPPGAWRTVCSVCRRWVDSLVYVSPQNRLARFCIDCAPEDVRKEILEARAKRNRSASEDVAEMYGDNTPAETPLPDGVSRVEDIGLPEQ